jgi:hypothetical protein
MTSITVGNTADRRSSGILSRDYQTVADGSMGFSGTLVLRHSARVRILVYATESNSTRKQLFDQA